MPEALSPVPPSPFEIAELDPTDEMRLAQAAEVLYEALRPISSGWPTVEAALGEVIEISKIEGGIVLVAIGPEADVQGLVGARPKYAGYVMELHPLAVSPGCQRQGIGRALVEALEEAVVGKGYSSIMLGSDDEAGRTSLAGMDLYPDPIEKLRAMTLPGEHAVGFYLKVGYSIAGVIPDANGPGKPDIWMTKRLIP